MRKYTLLLSLICIFFIQKNMAQKGIIVIDTNKSGKIKFARIDTSINKIQTDSEIFLKSLLKIDKNTDFYLYKDTRDNLKMRHETFQQTYKGVKVEFGLYSIHRDSKDNIILVNGDFADDISEQFSIIPKNNFKETLNKYLTSQKTKNYTLFKLPEKASIKTINSISTDTIETVIIKGLDNRWHLTYKIHIGLDNQLRSSLTYIDSKTGEAVLIQPMVYDSNVTGTAETMYSGTRNIVSDSFSGGFRLREAARGGTSTQIQTFNFNRASAYYVAEVPIGIANATDFTDNDNNWTAAEYNNANHDQAALDAHWGIESTFDYFKNVHQRNSYDNANGTITNYVHVRTRDINNNIVDMDNAFWNQTYHAMFYGDGNFFNPTVALDICGHELGHGVCNTSIAGGSGLLYQKDSGALNESLSDIWGACVEHYIAPTKQTWIMGEDIGSGFRSMSNPKAYGQPDTYLGTNWVNTTSCTPSEFNDYCGVHTNSGVGNKWFYLLSEGGSGTNDIANSYNVTGIGISNAAAIVYRAETTQGYLSSNSDYTAMRNATIEAAKDISMDYNSCMVKSVTDAWYAVGVGTAYSGTLGMSISGSLILCDEETYTISNLPTGATVTWSIEGWCAEVSSSSGNQAEVARIDYGSFKVKALVSTACGTIELKTDEIVSGFPYWVGVTDVSNDGMGTSYGILCSSTSGQDNYVNTFSYKVHSWASAIPFPLTLHYMLLNDQGGTFYQSSKSISSDEGTVNLPNNIPSGFYDIEVWISGGACEEESEWYEEGVEVVGCGYYRMVVYPNPSNTELNIAYPNETAQSKTTKTTTANPFSVKLFNEKGKVLKEGRTAENSKGITLQVADIPNGIYYLHIYEGKKVSKQQVVIAH